MNVTVDISQAELPNGRVVGLDVRVTVKHSPREGFNNEKLGQIEKDLSGILRERLNAAINCDEWKGKEYKS